MKVFFKISLVLALFFAMNWLYEQTLLKSYLELEAEQYLQMKKIASCDVIYFSESSNFSPDNSNDNDRSKLSQFIAQHYPNQQFEAVNKPAAHAGTYGHLLELIPKDSEVRTIIIAVNLRSFGASWIHSELESALNKSNVMYNQRPPLLNRFLVSLNAYDNASEADRKKQMLSEWGKPNLPYSEPHNTVNNWCAEEKWGDWKNPKRQLADQFIKQFALVIDEENPRVKDLDAIVDLAQKSSWNLVYSIIAEDVIAADSLVGTDLTSLMKSNAAWLESRYSSKGIKVINNLEVLSSAHFVDKDFPTEHYDETGRRIIAEQVAKAIRPYMIDQKQKP
jgi:hypothetical protein